MATPPIRTSVGVYVLANDLAMDWLIAFLESFRAHNPDLLLTVLPFDERMDQVRALAPQYRFDIFEHPDLPAWDTLGRSFAEGRADWWTHAFRRFALFDGPYEHFLCLDADIVILDDLTELLSAFARSGLDFCFFDQTDEWIYITPELMRLMKERYAARPFNAGFWMGRKGAFSPGRVRDLAGEAQLHRQGFYYGADQPFLNFCVHTSGIAYGGVSDLIPDLAHHHWAAGWRRIRNRDGAYRVTHRASPDCGKRVVLLHWAGHRISSLMPYRRLYLSYRLRPLSGGERLTYRLRAGTRYLFCQFPQNAVRRVKQMVKRCCGRR